MIRRAPPAPSLLALVLLLVSCRSGGGGGDAMRAARPPAEPVIATDAGDAADAADAGAATNPPAGATEAPRATRSDVTFSAPWVVLGQHLVDTRSAHAARTLRFGEIVFSADTQHFALFDGREVVFGATTDAASDLVVSADIDGLYRVALAANGSSALIDDRAGATHLVDVRARTDAVVARRRPDANAASPGYGRHSLSRDGRRATTLVALFDDELIATRLSSGAPLAHPHHVDDFLLADDGKTLAWQDATARLQTVVFFDAEHVREGRHVVIEDEDPWSPQARYRGVCSGGTFSLGSWPSGSSLTGTVLSAERRCSLLDVATVDLATGLLIDLRSATPADQFATEQRQAAICARAKLTCTAATSVTLVGERRAVMIDRAGHLALFDASSGRRIALLAGADDTSMDHDFAVAPDGKTVAAVDASSIARLWDGATGKLLWSAPSDAEPR